MKKLDPSGFKYRIPQALCGQLAVGMAVMIPFGRGNKLIRGYVMELTDKAEYDERKLKEIASIVKRRCQCTGGTQSRLAGLD